MDHEVHFIIAIYVGAGKQYFFKKTLLFPATL
jgi:hypothetical protein